jgi:hypothetical protein
MRLFCKNIKSRDQRRIGLNPPKETTELLSVTFEEKFFAGQYFAKRRSINATLAFLPSTLRSNHSDFPGLPVVEKESPLAFNWL